MPYAVSVLLDTLEQLLHSPDLMLPYQREQLESLQKKFTFFEGFLLQSPAEFNGDEFLRHMRRIIRCLAGRAEDYVAGILFSRSIEAGELEERNQILDIHQKAQEMFEEIDFIEAEVLRFCGEADSAIQLHEENCSTEGLSLQALQSANAFDETFLAILDRVTGDPSTLQYLAIVGTRRMGKTTFAKRIFNDPFVLHRFYIRAWITISEGTPVREILLGLLKCIGCLTDGIYEKSDGQLSEKLYQRLRGQRYLIVLDNLWSTKLWDIVKRWFPDDKNGSRVLLTSRLMNLGVQVHQNRSSYHQHFPSVGERWKHFQEILFSEDYDPLELVKTGEEIAQEDQGLLLAIILTAAILAKISDTPNYWGDFMQKAGSVMSESVKDIFTLNFNQLPLYLRTCFSYIDVLPDDCEIFLYIITKVWNSLGLLRPERLNRLEEVAKVHFKDLVESSMNMNKIRWSDCRVKRNFIPDLLWDLNCRRAQKEKFLDLITKSLKFVSVFMDDCHFSLCSEIHLCVWLRPIVPLTRSFQCFGMEEWFRPNKSSTSVYGLKKRRWTTEEDKRLMAYVIKYGCWNWRQLPKFAGLARCGKCCRLRWLNYLKPGIKPHFSDEETTIIRLHRDLGNRWSAIAAILPGRTENEIKKFWHGHLKKEAPYHAHK